MSETKIEDSDRVAHWQRVVHALAKEKGWHDEPAIPRRFQMLGNVMVEVGEMWEEARAKDFDPKRIYVRDPGADLPAERVRDWRDGDALKPEGFPIELADVVIRVLDTAGALGIEMWDHRIASVSILEHDNPDLWMQMTRLMREVALLIEDAGPLDMDDEATVKEVRDDVEGGMAFVLARCEAIAQVASIDLWRAVEIKHVFNRTRSRRHGGKRS